MLLIKQNSIIDFFFTKAKKKYVLLVKFIFDDLHLHLLLFFNFKSLPTRA